MTRKRSRSLVGAKLKKARERHGISLRQVADSTKISVPVLQALERDDISNLPGGLLGRGFVRSFAAAVHLDPEAIVAEFVAQFPVDSLKDGYRADGDEIVDAPPTEVPFRVREWEASRMLRLAAVGLLPAALVVYLVVAKPKPWQHWAAIQSTVVGATSRLADSAIRAATSSDAKVVEVQRSAEPPAQPAASGPPPTVSPHAESAAPPAVPRSAPAPVVAQKPSTKVTPAAPPAPDESPANAANAATLASAKIAATADDANRDAMPDARALADESLKVMLSVTSPSWVIATVDGKNTVSRLLDVGDQEMLEASHELVLTAGDGGAIVMTLNGAAARSLGRMGETIKVRVNRGNLRDYLRQTDPPRESP